MKPPKQLFKNFGFFWWEFLLGENPDAFFGTLIIVGAALLLRHHRATAIPVVSFLSVVLLAGSAYRGRKRVSSR